MSKPLWLRSWRTKKRVHIEVRDPDMSLEVLRSYKGKDHTLHIILKESRNGTATRPNR